MRRDTAPPGAKEPGMFADEFARQRRRYWRGEIRRSVKNRTTDYISSTGIICWLSKAIPLLRRSACLYHACCPFSVKRTSTSRRWRAPPVIISEDREAQLAARLLQFEETLTQVARRYAATSCAVFAGDVAGLFSGFYEHCPILSAENDAVRNSRLKTGATGRRRR